MLAAIGAAVDRSEELIEALLTLARSDRGPGPGELVDLPTAVEDAIDLIAPAAAARQIRIDTALQDAQVTGDRVLIERLVSNLIDNAVKHNVTGGWVLASTRTDAGTAELTVANGGEHIPADQVPGLFEPFRRLCGRTGNRPGTGLGLSIVASIAHTHGGHAQARARPDGGLNVQITLPATANGHRPAPRHCRSQSGTAAPDQTACLVCPAVSISGDPFVVRMDARKEIQTDDPSLVSGWDDEAEVALPRNIVAASDDCPYCLLAWVSCSTPQRCTTRITCTSLPRLVTSASC